MSNFGALHNELISRLAALVGVPEANVVALCNGTTALQGATSAAPPEEALSLPSWTFTASAAAVASSCGTGHFVDVSSTGWPVFEETDSHVLDVLPFGSSFRPERYQTSRYTVVDAAASLLSFVDRGKEVMQLPHVGFMFSMHATKTFSTGEGGLFISANEEWCSAVRSWSNFGFDGSRSSVRPGLNGKLSEYAAAVGLASLDNLESTIHSWGLQRSRAAEISRALSLDFHPSLCEAGVSPYWVVRVENETERDRLEALCSQSGIDTRRWWNDGCHAMPAYKHFSRDSLHQTEDLARTTLGLPLHPHLSNEDWRRLECCLESFRVRVTSAELS